MNNTNYEWLSKRTYRAVDELRLWPDNPRLNPDESHVYLSDYAEDLISDEGERDGLCELVKSIAEMGFIPSLQKIFSYTNFEIIAYNKE